jgi:hypothetical protein
MSFLQAHGALLTEDDMARFNGFVLGVGLAAITACAGAPVAEAPDRQASANSTLDQLRQDRSAAGRDRLAKYLYQVVSDTQAQVPAGTTREALGTEGINAAVAAAAAGADLNGWVAVAYWLQIPVSFDATEAAAVTCKLSAARPTVELIGEACGDLLQRRGDSPGAMGSWRRAIDAASQRADAMRLINNVLQVSVNPERDLWGVSTTLIAQARMSQEHQRQYGICVAECDTTGVGCVAHPASPGVGIGYGGLFAAAASRGAANLCVVQLFACHKNCGTYLQ